MVDPQKALELAMDILLGNEITIEMKLKAFKIIKSYKREEDDNGDRRYWDSILEAINTDSYLSKSEMDEVLKKIS